MKKEIILSLLQLPKVGLKTATKILEKASGKERNADDLYNLLIEIRPEIPRLKEYTMEEISLAMEKAFKIIKDSEQNNIQVISIYDKTYPKKFRDLKDAPLILYLKGNVEVINASHAVAVIGTREPSDFGRRAGYKLTKYFVEHELTIVSGLAIGCDTVGHRSCLDHGGKTVAVMAGGLDKIYPKQNRELADEILEKGGAIISEYPMGTTPRNNFFVERDRLQSGLSDGICIIETDRKGGTMHTFKFATEQKRYVGALLHPPQYHTNKSNGNTYLIEEKGAYPLGSSDEILRFINLLQLERRDSKPENLPNQEGYKNDEQLKLFKS